jgi:hypothetical protein
LRHGNHRSDRHEEQQHQTDGHRHAVEVGATDENAAVLQRFDDQREDRAQQHDERERAKKTLLAKNAPSRDSGEVDAPGRPQSHRRATRRARWSMPRSRRRRSAISDRWSSC